MTRLHRITQDPEVMGGRPCIRGLRVTVGTIVGLLAAGHDADEVLAAYPYLERDDISQALAYAAWRAEEQEVTVGSSASPFCHLLELPGGVRRGVLDHAATRITERRALALVALGAMHGCGPLDYGLESGEERLQVRNGQLDLPKEVRLQTTAVVRNAGCRSGVVGCLGNLDTLRTKAGVRQRICLTAHRTRR